MSDLIAKPSSPAFYSEQKNHFNVFVSCCGGLKIRFNTVNVRIIKRHIDNEDADQKILTESKKLMEPIRDFKGIYTSCLRYNSEYCWWNGHLSRNERKKLKPDEVVDAKSIIEGLKIIKPLHYNDLQLFHAFEFHIKYNESKWKIGSIINFSFFLSKTLSWNIASFFSNQSRKFCQKYLVCKYNQSGSKHICVESRFNNNEYEYLSFGENFKFVEKIYQLGISFWYFLPIPTIRVYYVMEYTGNELNWKKDQRI